MRETLVRLLLFASVLLLYAQTLSFGFVDIDDRTYVTEVEAVTSGLRWQGVHWAFTDRRGVAYQPVTWLSHMLDFELFGDAPAGHHATSVLLHAVNALLLFELLRRTTGRTAPAALAAALFAWHPLRVESVAWIAERKDVLSTAFALAALHAWVGWTRVGGAGRYAASLVWLALGLLSKPAVVTLPAIMLLLDHWPLGRLRRLSDARPLLLEKLPHFALVAASSAATLVFQRSAMSEAHGLGAGERVANALLAYATYLRKAVWPSDLAVHYAHPYLEASGAVPPELWQVAACGALVAAATWCTLRPGAPRAVRVGWLWFLGALVPMLGLVQVGSQALADRYTYLPMIGLALAAGYGGFALHQRLRDRAPWLAPAVATGACAALLVASALQTRSWRDSVRLFEQAHAVEPTNVLVNVALGKAYGDVGRAEQATQRFEAALEVAPDHALANYNYATLLAGLGRWPDAERHFRAALATAPDDPRTLGNLAGALQMQDRSDEAIAVYRETLRHHPDDAVALRNLAELELASGRAEAALALYRRHLDRHPSDAAAWTRLAGMLRGLGALDAAVEAYERAVRLAPDAVDAHLGLGNALGRRGELERAVAHLRRAVALRPGHAAARANLELALRLQQTEAREAAASTPARPVRPVSRR